MEWAQLQDLAKLQMHRPIPPFARIFEKNREFPESVVKFNCRSFLSGVADLPRYIQAQSLRVRKLRVRLPILRDERSAQALAQVDERANELCDLHGYAPYTPRQHLRNADA